MEATLSALLLALKDSNPTVRDRAAQSLGKMSFDPSRRAQALTDALQTELRPGGNEIVIWKILGALTEIGPPARSAVRLLGDLSRTNNISRTLATIALTHIQPENPNPIQQLIHSLNNVTNGEAMWAAWELGKKSEMRREAIEPLLRLAKTTEDVLTRIMAATAAWRMDPSAPSPLGSITNFLSTPGTAGKYEVVRLVGELGPAARDALPALLQLRYSRGIMMHEYANDALRTVAPEYRTNPWGPHRIDKDSPAR